MALIGEAGEQRGTILRQQLSGFSPRRVDTYFQPVAPIAQPNGHDAEFERVKLDFQNAHGATGGACRQAIGKGRRPSMPDGCAHLLRRAAADKA